MYVETAGVWSLEAKLLPLDGAAGDEFGTSVDIEGERILVGAPRRDMVGVGADVGAAYVFQRSGTVWTQEVQLLATDPSASALYGYSVAIAAEDHVHTEHADLRGIVGAPQDSLVVLNGGSAYSIKLVGVTWSTEAKLTDVNAVADDRFGTAVDMMGSMAIVGSPGDDDFVPDGGSIFAFEESHHAWPQTQHKYGVAPTNPTRLLGSSVAIGHETVMAGAPREEIQGKTDAGEVYLWFTEDPINWMGEVAATETPADNAHLGASVATSGQWMVSGADRDSVLGPNSGSVSIYPGHQHFDPYCTAGTSANGCQALMGATGIPSASAPSGGFVAFAHSGVPKNDGMFLYSSNGQQAVPSQGSTSYQCVVPPVIRTPVKKSTGTTGQCDGVATIDLNAFWGPRISQPGFLGSVMKVSRTRIAFLVLVSS